MRTLVAVFLTVATVAACSADLATDPAWDRGKEPLVVIPAGDTVRLLFVGDVMLGRSVAPIVLADAHGVFADVRHIISESDLALFNLESPLTNREHEAKNPNVLEAPPEAADLLRAAGFDVADLANNHSGDAGLAGIRDSVAALADVGLRSVGVGGDGGGAAAPLIIDAGSIQIAILAFDLTWAGPIAGEDPGVATWDAGIVADAVGAAHAVADVVVVGVHGGIEYRTESDDPMLQPAIDQLVGLGVDVVWGHGAHVVQPIYVADAAGTAGPTLAASSLGNFLFDQRIDETGSGAVLEVLANGEGVLAYRVGRTDHRDLRVRFLGWDLPEADAVVVEGQWWSLPRAVDAVADKVPSLADEDFQLGDVFDTALGDITGDGISDLVVSYRYPFRETLANQHSPAFYTDALGRAAHFGIFEPGTLRKIWAAGTLQRPVEAVQPCDGVLGFGYSELNDRHVIATGAAVWSGFGFSFLPDLDGSGTLHCADIDADGRLELIVTR